MPKNQATEDDIRRGIEGVTDLTAFQKPKVVRDNPFRDTRNDPLVVPERQTEKPPDILPSEGFVTKSNNNKVVSKLKKSSSRSNPRPKRNLKAAKISNRTLSERQDHTEKVTVPMDIELRDSVQSLARQLHNSRRVKAERITSNTVMRVAIRAFLEEFSLDSMDSVNDEQELFELVKKKLYS